MNVAKPYGKSWKGVIGFSAGTPLGIEAPVYENGRAIHRSDYGNALPDYRRFFPEGGKLFQKPAERREVSLDDKKDLACIAFGYFPRGFKVNEIRSRLSSMRKLRYNELGDTNTIPSNVGSISRENGYELIRGIRRYLKDNSDTLGIGEYVRGLRVELARRIDEKRDIQ